MKQRSAICIIGGMGPQASSYMYGLLIEMSVRYFGAKNNDEFPEIILHSIPVPDFVSDDAHREEALRMLTKSVESLNKLNVSRLAVACNTVHVFLGNLQSVSKIPFISMIEEVGKEVSNEGRKKIGLLCSPSTLRYRLYQLVLAKYGIETVVPDRKQMVVMEKIIRAVLRGRVQKEDRKKLITIADTLHKQGAEAIILGCTELPLVFPSKYSLPVYNSVKILALALLRNYYK